MRDALKRMPWRNVLDALEKGKMKAIGELLTPAQRLSIAEAVGGLSSPPMLARRANCARLGEGDWNDGERRVLGVLLDGEAIPEMDERGHRITGDSLLNVRAR